jgi:hypothetical protein
MTETLNAGDCYTLRQASCAGIWSDYDAEDRCRFYMKKGHCKADAMRYAIAWAKNAAEQAARRRRC